MSTAYIKNHKQLADTILEKYAASALKKTQQIIFDVIQESMLEYYKEYDPKFYNRKFKLLNSLIKTEVIRTSNTVSCEVKIDEAYLKYAYPDNGGLRATGLDVVQWANRDVSGYGNHGGTVNAGRDEGVWNIGLRDLGGETGIMKLLIGNLKKRGLSVV